MSIPVILEVAPKRAFASAIDWPGWSRGGRTPDGALEGLAASASRYATVAKRARLRFPARVARTDLEVTERVDGDGSTEFGIPGKPAAAEQVPISTAELRRFVALLRAAWDTLDAAADAAEGVTLTTGPRGGGRSLSGILDHVRDAELAYTGQLGSRTPDPAAVRDTFIEALTAIVEGRALPHPRNTRRPWLPRYAVRRLVWHALDHAWEIEDRAALNTTGELSR